MADFGECDRAMIRETAETEVGHPQTEFTTEFSTLFSKELHTLKEMASIAVNKCSAYLRSAVWINRGRSFCNQVWAVC